MDNRTPSEIIHHVAEIFHAPVEDITGTKRKQPASIARQTAMYAIRICHPHTTLQAIGELFPNQNQKGRHHTTVGHAIQSIRNLIETQDPKYLPTIKLVEEWLEGGCKFAR